MSWDSAMVTSTLRQLRAFGDDTTLIECKRSRSELPKNVGETLCAFANMPEGGILILGVDENSGFSIVGVDNPAAMEKKVVNLCRQSVTPSPQLTFDHVAIDDKKVVVISVSALLPSQKPAFYRGKAYLRQADGDYPMNPNDLRLVAISALHESERADFDMEVFPGTNAEQLDPELLRNFLSNVRGRSARLSKISNDDLLLQITNVTDKHGNIRLAGLYALGLFPQTTEPALGATVAVRLSRSESGGRNKKLLDLEGPLPELVEESMKWIRHNTDTVVAYDAHGHMVNRPEFPASAVREIVANAFVHRDLGPSLEVGKRVEIRVTEKALIIQNPGGLRGLSVAQLESAELTKAAVNQRLYEIAKQLETSDGLRVIEGEGGGIREVLIATQEARLPAPIFIDSGVQFKVLFPRGSRFSPEEQAWLQSFDLRFSAPQEDLLVALRRGESYSYFRLRREYAPLSEADLKREVRYLVEHNVIAQEDNAYVLVRVLHPPAQRKTVVPEKISKLGKNVPVVFETLSGGQEYTIKELQASTGLSTNQVRYALAPLIETRLVLMRGGQGARKTTYKLIK